MEPPWVSSANNNKKKKGYKMRIHKLTPIIVSLVVLGVITAAFIIFGLCVNAWPKPDARLLSGGARQYF